VFNTIPSGVVIRKGKNMQSKVIAGALPIAAKMLAGRLDINLKFGGSTAMTNGKTIIIPHLPLDSDRARILAFGYLVHENGHIRDTDFKVGAGTKPLSDMENILEDIRIERCAWKRYPGAQKTLLDLVELLVAEKKMGKVPQSSNPVDVLLTFMLQRLRATVLQQSCLDPAAVQTEAVLRSMLPDAVCDTLTTMMFSVEKCRDTADVVLLSKAIFDYLLSQLNPPQQQPQPQPQNSASDQDGEDSGGDDGDLDVSGRAKPNSSDSGDDAGVDADGSDSSDSQPDQSTSQGDSDQGDSAPDGQDADNADANAAGASGAGDGEDDSESDGTSTGVSDASDEPEGDEAGEQSTQGDPAGAPDSSSASAETEDGGDAAGTGGSGSSGGNSSQEEPSQQPVSQPEGLTQAEQDVLRSILEATQTDVMSC
jgi:cobaltochelatase CobT